MTVFPEGPYNQAFTPSRMTPEISVVVPMRNESPNVAKLYEELTTTLEAFKRPY